MNPLQILKKQFRKSRKASWNRKYDAPDLANAENAYANLLAQDLKFKCSTQQLNLLKSYSIEVLGSISFMPWLKVYTAYQHEFKEGWMPNNYFGRVVCPEVNGKFKSLGELKTMTKRMLRSENIPDLAYRINGLWSNTQGEILHSEELTKLLFSDRSHVFLKKNNSLQGKGILKLNKQKFAEIDFSKEGGVVIQAPIQQNDWSDQIVKGSVATLRITTIKPFGKLAKNRVSQLRVGRDFNEYIRTQDCIRIPIDTDSGELHPVAFGGNFQIYDKHPDSGYRFKNQYFPSYHAAVAYCEQLHNEIGLFQIIGWDIAINQLGEVQLMEWNTDHPGIIFSEMASGPHFKGLGWEQLWK